MAEFGDRHPVRGLPPGVWEGRLSDALDRHDHVALRDALTELCAEIGGQFEEVHRRSSAATLDRLVEHARRLLGSEPTDSEQLEAELDRERRLWARFRRRYRHTFVPPELRPFLDSCGVFLGPTSGGVQFPGFEKYAGSCVEGTPHAVTLFRRSGEPGGDETPANFFATFDPGAGRFTVERCYRTGLPRGAGELCIHEQLESLLGEAPGAMRQLVFDNVQNRATYDAHVAVIEGSTALRDGVRWVDTPLGRLGERVLRRAGFGVAGVRPTLDTFDCLDLGLEVSGG